MAVGKEYDLLIYEMLFFPAKRLADRLGIPSVRQFSQPAWNQEAFKTLAASSKLFLLSSKLIGKQLMNPSAARAMGLEELNLVDSVLKDQPNFNIVYLPDFFQPLAETFDEQYIFVPPNRRQNQSQAILIPYHKMTDPIIYISLGTIISSKAFYRKGLAAFADKPVSVILSTGKMDPKKLGKLPDNLYAYNFVPQVEVLQKCKLFITHGGMNSVCEAMACGVPMLVLPILNDQPINAAQVVELKIGRKLSFVGVSADKLANEALQMLANPELKKHCKMIQQKLSANLKIDDAAIMIEKICNKKTIDQ